MSEYIIEMLNITKRFPGIIANDNITLRLKKGEIHALLGENGAGKSTLMSILFGLYQPDEGTIKKDGNIVKIENPNVANKLKIGMVHQHFKLVEDFTVLENIILGVENTKNGFLDYKEAINKINDLSKKYNLIVDLNKKISEISVGMQQKVEILKMLYRDNDILIFDEPTAVLTIQEIDELMKIMENFKKEGKSILFITHKLNEIMKVASSCTILRKGKYVGVVDVKKTTPEELSKLMVGRTIDENLAKKKFKNKKEILKVSNMIIKSKITSKNIVDNASIVVKTHEIVSLLGIEGNGQNDFVNGLIGLKKIENGSIKICDEEISNLSIRYRNLKKIACIPEDRHKHGLVLEYNVKDNLMLKKYFYKEFQKYGFINKKKCIEYANRLIKEYDIRSSNGIYTTTRQMSGGNQQKIIIAREMDLNPKLLIAVQPTRGLDVGAIEVIHKRLLQKREEGCAILLVSFEIDEVLKLSDIIYVIYEGKIVGKFNTSEANKEVLGLYMSGAKKEEVND